MSENYALRFGGIKRLVGEADQQKIAQGHILVVGLGGVGSWVTEALARSGVGALTLVDFDDICITNTNRQSHALTESIGRQKTQVLKERLLSINPELQIDLIGEPYSRDIESEVFSRPFDGVIDCIDKSITKEHLIVACRGRGIPVVVAGSAAGRIDPTAIRLDDLSNSCEDSLLSLIRKNLRRQYGFPRKDKMNISCVFSTEKAKYWGENGEIQLEKPQGHNRPLDCSTGMGTISTVTGTFAFFLAHQALKDLCEREK